MTTVLNVAVAGFTLASVALTLLAWGGWYRSKRPKIGVLAAGFTLFAAAGLIASWWLFSREDLEGLLTITFTLTGAGLLTIYIASVKR